MKMLDLFSLYLPFDYIAKPSQAFVRSVRCFFMLGLISCIPYQVSAQPDEQVDQIAAVGKLWGMVRVYHPWAGANPEAWDKALVSALPAIRQARDKKSYSAAISHMLAQLNDPVTRVLGLTDSQNIERPEPGAMDRKVSINIEWIENKTAYIQMRDWLGILNNAGGLNALHAPLLVEIFKEAQSADTLILDFRRYGHDYLEGAFDPSEFYLPIVLERELPLVLAKPMTLPTIASREHYGYRNEGITAAVYYSGTMVRDMRVIPPQAKTAPNNVVILTNADASSSLYNLIVGMQSSGLASVVHEGSLSGMDQTVGQASMVLPYNVMASVRTHYSLAVDGSSGYAPNLVLPENVLVNQDAILQQVKNVLSQEDRVVQKALPAYQTSLAEPRYTAMKIPTVEYRLLALFKFWAAIEHYFPYRDLLDKPWEEALPALIPEFIHAKNEKAYVVALAKLGVRTQDSHTSIQSTILADLKGLASPPVVVQEVEGRSVIVHVAEGYKPKQGTVRVGDVILKINGQKTAKRVDFLNSITPGSTPHAQSRNTHLSLLGGDNGTEVTLVIRGGSGKSRKVTMVREIGANVRADLYKIGKSQPAFSRLSEDTAYLDLSRVQQWTLEQAMHTIEGAEKLVLDMRGYPNLPLTSVLEQFGSFSGEMAQIRTKVLRAYSPFLQTEEHLTQPMGLLPNDQPPYEGKVVVLVNSWAQSAAEHSILGLKAAFKDRMTLIGSPSAGANGTITFVYLPGGITVSFTGQSVEWPDGSQLQRIGVVPDVAAAPTIKGLREGRDEPLEAALDFLSKAE